MSVTGIVAPAPLPPPERPQPVTVIGWVWIVIGILRVLASVFGLLAWKFGGLRETLAGSGPSFLSAFVPAVPLRLAFHNFAAALVLQLATGVLFLYAGAGLLRLRAWARSVIEIVCWIAFVFVVCSGVIAIAAAFFAPIAPGAPPRRTLAVGIAVLIIGALAWAFAAMIRALRRPEIRSAFSKT